MENTNCLNVLDKQSSPEIRETIVNDSAEKRRIISLLNIVIHCYKEINGLLKTTSKGDDVFHSRVTYGAMRKDISSSLYHAKLQKDWVITEKDSWRF